MRWVLLWVGFCNSGWGLEPFEQPSYNEPNISWPGRFVCTQQGEVVQTLAVVPDVISIVDAETAEPIPTEEVRYGQRVAIVIIPAPPPMTTPRALEVVGPAAFGYPEVEYRPLGYYREPTPIPPSWGAQQKFTTSEEVFHSSGVMPAYFVLDFQIIVA